ncbi:Saccharopine dehydrogenase, partial [Conidiobolus coronatus NRRL 28638]
EADELLKAVTWLGLLSETSVVKKNGTLIDTLCHLLESKMMYLDGESDMVLLQHSFKVENKDGSKELITTTLQKFGEPFPKGPSAMATCVGVPCAIGVSLILDGGISKRGVLAPVTPEIANPILEKLEATGIKCIEKSVPIH